MLDQFGTGAAQTLQDQIEAVDFVRSDAVEIDRGTQVLARARGDAGQHQRCGNCRQRNGRSAAAIDDAHDDRGAAAVLESCSTA
jgi:hypothetical protein